MPAKTPALMDTAATQLVALGGQIRAHRKALKVSATAAAQSANMSRVTLHRIEAGEASVTMGAYLNAMAALGLQFGMLPVQGEQPESVSAQNSHAGWIPARIALSRYPQLQRLAWQVQGTDTLTPREALGIYERNARHLDVQAMAPHERDLIEALRTGLGEGVEHGAATGV